jgi:translation initiation factor IF-3
LKERINTQIRAQNVRVIDEEGNLGVMTLLEALDIAKTRSVDLIEVSPFADPPVCKLMEYGKYLYQLSKKEKQVKAGAKQTETKSIQIKIATGEHDLELKAKQASKWLAEGHRLKAELFLKGRTKYMKEEFLTERLERFLNLITENYKVADPIKKSPKGFAVTLERDNKKKHEDQ